MPVGQPGKAGGRRGQRTGGPQPAPGGRGAVCLSFAALKGALLADEVGLGKTIEAGLVLSQRWAERKRRILDHHAVQPAQAVASGADREVLPAVPHPRNQVLQRSCQSRPLSRPSRPRTIVICSYQFARNKAADVASTPWDLVVIDEAHRLRNVYKPSNVIANTLKLALAAKDKLLLTATPLQNSLLELFGLVSFIDEHAFGDLKSFREQFANLSQEQVFEDAEGAAEADLPSHAAPAGHAHTSPTRSGMPLVEEFTPEESEDRLYELVSEYLRRDNLQALPSGQRSLMTLVLRKLLASSTFAIAGALDVHVGRGSKRQARATGADRIARRRTRQGLRSPRRDSGGMADEEPPAAILSEADRAALESEDRRPREFASARHVHRAQRQGQGAAQGAQRRFRKARELGAAEKAIIFTESRSTQNYLLRVLADSRSRDGIVLFNGTNTDERSKSDLRSVAGKAPGHGSRHRLADRRHALGARGLLPRARAAS